MLIALALCQAGPQHALAFTNRIGELSPNRQGVPYGVITPTPRGVGTGGKPLRGCPSTDDKLARPPPNCFSSADPEDNGHFLAPWTYKKDPKEAWADVLTGVCLALSCANDACVVSFGPKSASFLDTLKQ